MYVSNRYCNFVAKWLDEISFLLMSPWLTIFSHFLSCYISTIFEKQHPQHKLIDYFLFGPIYAVLLLLVLPFGVSGIIIWIALCAITDQEKYTYLCVREHSIANDKNRELNSGTYTLASINVLLAPEAIARLNNNKYSYARTSKIAERILNHTGKHLCNLISQDDFEMKSKYNSVLAEFPCLDFLCLQEVWERAYALVLIEQLKKEFSYFLYDIGDYSFSNNFCMLGECYIFRGNLVCSLSDILYRDVSKYINVSKTYKFYHVVSRHMLLLSFISGSGLFFASKKPILDADFKMFSLRTKHARCTSQGVLCIKVRSHLVFI